MYLVYWNSIEYPDGIAFSNVAAFGTTITVTSHTKNDILNLNKLIIKDGSKVSMTLETTDGSNKIKVEPSKNSTTKGITLLGTSKIYVREICDDN